jgi:hypothetical protein
MAKIVTLDPTSGPIDRKDARVFPPRPVTLDGAVIGLVVNGIGRCEALFDAVYAEMAKQFEGTRALKVVKKSVAVPPEKPDWQRLTSEATVAITGFGG